MSSIEDKLARYAIRLAGMRPEAVRFVIVDGSAGVGQDREYSDYDLVVMPRREQDKRESWGAFEGRLVSMWSCGPMQYRKEFYSFDDDSFVWRRKLVRKARLLYGDARDFRSFRRAALAVNWTVKRQNTVVTSRYGMVMENYGKMLNEYPAKGNLQAFYYAAQILAEKFAELVAAVNRIDLDSDRTLYRQATSARIKPASLGRDLTTLSSLDGRARSKAETLAAAGRLAAWIRGYLKDTYGLERLQADSGFREALSKLKF